MLERKEQLRKNSAIYFCRRLTVPDSILQVNGQDILFVNKVTYLGVALSRRMTRRQHIERTVAKALLTYVRTYSLFRSGCLSTNIKLTLDRILIRSVMTYACPTWEYVVDVHLFKLQHLQSRVLCSIGNLDRCTPVCKLHVAFKIPYVYDYINKLCRTQAEVILNHVNSNVCGTGHGVARHKKYKRL
jgi:hypothetical protein